MTGRMPRPSMKKITAGQGPFPLAGVKTEAGQFPSRVLIVTSARDITPSPVYVEKNASFAPRQRTHLWSSQMSVRISLEHVRLKRRLRFEAVLIPLAAPIVGQAPRCRLAFTIVVGDAIAQRGSGNVNITAMLRILVFRLLADIDDARTAFAHGLQHPDKIVSVRVDHAGEIEAATTALWTGNDEQVGEAAAMQAKESPGPFGLPLLL